MSSYHPHLPRSVVPPPRRSASSAVAQALRNANRPRSGGSLYSNPYSAYSSTYSSPTSSSSYLSSSPSSSYHSPSTSYLSSPSSYKPATSSYHLNPSTYKSSYTRSSSSRRSPSRFTSGMGPRSVSASSLSGLSTKSGESEGYISEDKSRLGSVSSLASSQPEENGELDYKKLYEAEQATNERLRATLRRTEDELVQVRNAKSPASEVEKRERRAMERKLSEMEEELKVLESMKQENQRLKDENGALIRVISKLSK